MHFTTFRTMRGFSIACAAIVLLMFPRFVASFGVVREHPVDLGRRPDVVAVSLDGGPWLPAQGIVLVRVIRSVPPGMKICYRFENRVVQCGKVRNVSEPSPHAVARIVNAIVALVFVLTGAGLAIVGVDRRAIAAAGMLAGFGLLFGADFLEPALVGIRDLSLQGWVIALWEWFPRYAALLCMLVFTAEFPATLPRSRVTSVLLAMQTVLVVVQTAILGIAHTPGVLDDAPLRVQTSVISLVLLNQKLAYASTAVGVILFPIRQRKHAASRPPQMRKSGSIMAAAILFGFGPPMALGVLQVIFNLTIGRRLIPFPVMAWSFLTVLALPAAVMYAVMAKRVDSVHVVVRRALLSAIADRVFPFVRFAPVLLIAIVLYANSRRPLADVVAAHPLALGLLLALAIVLFALGDHIQRTLQAMFFRNEAATRARLGALASLVTQAQTIDALEFLLEQELDAAFHPERIALFVRQEREQLFDAIRTELPALCASSIVAAAIASARCPLAVDGLDDMGLAETERHWLNMTGASLLVPLFVSDRLLAILAIGEKRSGLPFDAADIASLISVAAAAALVIENERLRSRSAVVPSARNAIRFGDDDAAIVCHACNRYYSPSVVSRCPVDDSELQLADVPYVLSGKYRFEERLGAGGMGVVYRARDLTLERVVAIKTLPRLSVETAARLRREARTAANLLHPSLATVFAVEAWRGIPMLVLEYLDDGTLADRVGGGSLPIDVIVGCGGSIADALAYVHARTILHRDVKPSNIGFSRGAGPKLLDFGLAHLLEDAIVQSEFALSGLLDVEHATPRRLSITSGVVGTPAYLSPEAVLGEPAHADFDLWSLSVTLYETITGSHPFVEHSIAATMNAILATSVPDARELRSDCPAALSLFLAESLDRVRERRPRSALEFAVRLRQAAPA